ncbi:Forkhead box E3, partial [Tulasnella sp. 408]
MAYPRQTHPWQAPYATQLSDASPTMEFPYPSPPYPPYVPNRPLSPSQVNPYSPELQASPGLSDAQYSLEGSNTTPELDPTGPSSFDSYHSPLFPVTTPQSDFSPLDVSVGLEAMECPADPSVRPEHTVNNMIKAALHDSASGKLPSRDILKAIQKRFPYFNEPDHQKKLSNTIRHHLSNSKGFVKLPKDPNMRGKGDYWAYDPEAAQAAKGAGIDVPESSSATGASHRRSPSTGASSPYPLPRYRGTDETIVPRSAATRSTRGVRPIR